MDEITYAPLTADRFGVESLDNFVRCQHVKECWRRVDGALALRPAEYTEDWTLEERRETAAQVLGAVAHGGAAFGAFSGGEVAGFAVLAGERLGSRGQYADLALFYVSEPFRGRGVGGTLFRAACAAAREMGAEKLYISAHSAREVMAAYWALGCTEAEEIDPRHSRAEPWDIQLEKPL